MTTEQQVKSILERILRLKEEQDALSEDIKEVYAEAKSNGFDKTALGIVVTAIRKRGKDPQKYAEHDQVASLYLAAYDGVGTPVATHAPAREASKPKLVAPSSAPSSTRFDGDDLEIPSYLRREPAGAA